MSRADIRFAALNLLPAALYSGFILFSFFLFGQVTPITWWLALALGAALWVVTGILRTLALRRNWFAGGAMGLLLRLAAGVIVGAFVVQFAARLTVLAAALAGFVVRPEGDTYGIREAVVYSIQVSLILGMWVASWAGWHLLRHRRQSEIARLRAESQRNALELDALRARLNPHFVFNALNNVRALINEDTERARELITRLSSILRHALEHSQRELVPLTEELAVVDDYLAIEAVHYEERLRVQRSIDREALSALVPPMLLQLLIENAIKHGIAQTPRGGTLALTAKMQPQGLLIEVGSPGRLGAGSGGHGVGLAYLRTRLAREETPGRFELKQQGEQVVARLEIPQPEAQAAEVLQAEDHQAGPHQAGPHQAGPHQAGPHQAGPHQPEVLA